MAGGTWNTSSPTQRAGAYFNFTAALQAAVTTGVQGTTAIIGTADWGPLGLARQTSGPGDYEVDYGPNQVGTLREAVFGALDGFDGVGAARVLSFRIAGAAKAKATVVLDDAVAADALTLTARYEGTRANSFHATVQSNAGVPANKDLILYENGVEIERWENVVLGENDAFVQAINVTAPSSYVVASVTGAADRALANIVGVVGGAGGFTGGNSGLTVTAGDVSAALAILATQQFDSIALANISDVPTTDALIAWLRDRNEQGKRCFAAIGGAPAEPLATAKIRATAYDAAATYRNAAFNVANLGATDLRRLSDDRVFSTAELAPRFAGHLAAVGFTRDMVSVTFTGYQVNNPLTISTYLEAQLGGVITFDNDTTERVIVDNSVSALKTTNTTDRPAAFKDLRTVAITHFIENTLQRVATDLYRGTLRNNDTGRRDLIGSFLKFLKDLEVQGALQTGRSEVTLDDKYQQTGDACFLKYFIAPEGVVKRIFSTVQVGT